MLIENQIRVFNENAIETLEMVDKNWGFFYRLCVLDLLC